MIKLFLLFVAASLIDITQAQNVGIGTTSPDESAQLDVSSSSKGFLPPRMTYAQRNEIQNPVAGLVIWCSDCDELQVFNGTTWKNMSGMAGSLPTKPSVTICSQVWMVTNLDVATYKNGDSIPQVTDATEWAALNTGAWCWYDNDSATYAKIYGRLYNFYAVNDARGLAPEGWHVPSDEEWTTLSTCLAGEAIAGAAMKETGTTHWLSPNNGATNSSGFTGLPGGYRSYEGSFNDIGSFGRWWSATMGGNTGGAWYRNLYYADKTVYRGYSFDYGLTYGFSVRCVKD